MIYFEFNNLLKALKGLTYLCLINMSANLLILAVASWMHKDFGTFIKIALGTGLVSWFLLFAISAQLHKIRKKFIEDEEDSN